MTIFGPAVVSAVTSTLLVRFFLGDEPVYRVAAFRLESVAEFVPFALIGVLAGPASALLVRSLRTGRRSSSPRRSCPRRSRWRSAERSSGAIGIFLPEVWGNGFEATNRILHGNPTLLFLLFILFGKVVATSSTIGSGGVGGVFTPTLLVGAALGGAVARIVQAAVPSLEAPVGGYALLGMGALMAGMTRAPLLAVIMIFELTQNTQVLLPMMVISVAAMLLGARLRAGVASTSRASARRASSGRRRPRRRRCRRSRSPTSCGPTSRLIPRTAPFSRVVRTFLETRSLYLYIGDEEGRLLGVIDLHDVKSRFADPELSDLVIAEDLVTEIPFVTPEEPLTSVNEKLWFRDLGQLPVVDSAETRRFLGDRHAARPARRLRPRGPAAEPPARPRPHGPARRRGVGGRLLRAPREAPFGRGAPAGRARGAHHRRSGPAQPLRRLGAGGTAALARGPRAALRARGRRTASSRATS